MKKALTFKAILKLIRPPNLPTLPGDVTVGMLLCTNKILLEFKFSDIILPLTIVFLIYCAGLIWNDVADYAEDSRIRPQRPIPSGIISRRTAFFIGSAMVTGAFITTIFNPFLFLPTFTLTVLVILYDFVIKKNKILAPLIMGSCRSMAILTGGASSSYIFNSLKLIWPEIVTAGLYISALTAVSRHENQNKTGPFLFVPIISILTGYAIITLTRNELNIPIIILVLLLLLITTTVTFLSKNISAFISSLLKLYIIIQISLMPANSPLVCYIFIVSMLPLSILLQRWFYSS